MRRTTIGVIGLAGLFLAACGGPAKQGETAQTDTQPPVASAPTPGSSVSAEALREAASTPAVWLTYGGTYDEQRHSRLMGINPDTVADLGVAWTYDLATHRGVEATPIVVDGVMYVTSAWSIVYALDAKTGVELWVFDPEVDRAKGANACCDVVNRGVAIWEGKVFVGTIDGRLIALDAGTGEVVWDKVTVDQTKPYTITGAPRVVKGKVLIGNGGAELGVRGYLSAYDADTGDMAWRFYTVPNPNKQPDGAASDSAFEAVGNVSWGDEGAWVTDGGGGTVWDSIVYDQVNDLIIFGVGNGSPWTQKVRDRSGGDNLFLSSIVAVRPETGEYVWHFQTTPGDNWDYTATQSIILADLPMGENGATRRVAMQAPKNGFFYVLDAATGAFLSGTPFVPLNWAEGLDETGRPIESPRARIPDPTFFQNPGPLGAHNWHPMAFNPDLGLAYIPAQEIPSPYLTDLAEAAAKGTWNTGLDFAADSPPGAPQAIMALIRGSLKGRLIAWDPVAGEPRWSVEHANAWNGGVLSTGGLVFQGQLGGSFTAYDAATGEQKWQADLKSGGASGPGTFEIDGEQYITMTTGWGSAYALAVGMAYDEPVPPAVGKVVTFKLGGTAEIAAADVPLIEPTPKTERFGDAVLINTGREEFARNCRVCHGYLAISSGVLPDLRWSALTADADAWQRVVHDGALSDNGMIAFEGILSTDQIEAIRAYVVDQAHITSDTGAGAP